MTIVFEAESANYGEGIGNVSTLKKVSRGSGESFSYISRQALRYNIVQQMIPADKLTPVKAEGSGEKKVIQYQYDTSIKDYPEIDLFGYMKTEKETTGAIRNAVVRLSHAIALETFNGDLDYLTNKGLFDRLPDGEAKGGNIAQSEIHKSFYAYTLTIDLERVGLDKDIEIANPEKAIRIKRLLKTIKFLYRDIRGRRENLSPIFAIGGIYNIKNPFFENRIKLKNMKIDMNVINSLDDEVKNNTKVGYIEGIFDNSQEIKKELNTVSIDEFFKSIEEKVDEYYG